MEIRDLRVALRAREAIDYHDPLFVREMKLSALYEEAQLFTHRFNQKGDEKPLSAAKIYATAILHHLYQGVVTHFTKVEQLPLFPQLTKEISRDKEKKDTLLFFTREFPSPLLNAQNPTKTHFLEEGSRALFIYNVMVENKAILEAAAPLLRPKGLVFPSEFSSLLKIVNTYVGENSGESDLLTFLLEPGRVHPDSLTDQINFILLHWKDILSNELKGQLLRALDLLREEGKIRIGDGGGGAPEVYIYTPEESEAEAYSADKNWMPNVVMLAKSTLVWLHQLSKTYNYPIERLDDIPDYELDLIARRGFTSLWLIGLWERSEASKKIKVMTGNPEAEASAYSLKGYEIAASLGGWEALKNLDERCKKRGIRLASDMVPNHTGIDSDWVVNHSDFFIQSPYPPFPSYTYNGEDLSPDSRVEIKLEDHYWDRSDAAVTFRRYDKETGEISYIFHGNDGTSMPWNDTAQIDFLNPVAREAVIQQILHVARNFQVIRFDAAMTLAKRHIQRLWYPLLGEGGDIPGRANASLSAQEFDQRIPQEFWREVVDRIAQEVPDTLLLAEAFWMMEGYFVRTLGMHRVYNSAFMNMLKNEENHKYRETMKNTLSFDPEILKRFVNFMNNPDEETAFAQFGNGDKYFGVTTLLATMPGLPMFGHGQIEGFKEKYGMEYSRSYWNEFPDEHLIREHEKRIFPLLKLRYLFSGVDYFELFDLVDNHHTVDSIFAYTNGTEKYKSLVLYNNRYEHAQGRINNSVQKMVRDGDSRHNRSRTLAESLGLCDKSRHYMLYEKFPEGLAYIVPSVTLFEEGLWVSLEGYQSEIWLNVREVEDKDGSYELLCQQLKGGGTATLERDLAIIRLQPLFRALDNFRSKTMLETISKIVIGEQVASKEIRSFALLAGEAYARLSILLETGEFPFKGNEVQPKELLDLLQNLIGVFQQEASLLAQGGKIIEELPIVIVAALLLKPFIVPGTTLEELASLIGRLHLEAFFEELLAPLAPPIEWEGVVNRALFILAPPINFGEEESSVRRSLEELFQEPLFRAAIGYNESEGVKWYHKESLQESFYYIVLGACLKEGIAVQERGEKMVRRWLSKEFHANYRVEPLLASLRGLEG
ncbi:MAG: alpha-amylase family glycosyl hydrolase [Sphaerochaetaceae bacterium]